MTGERALLQRLIEGPVSGHALADEAGLTRAAMWTPIPPTAFPDPSTSPMWIPQRT